MPRKPNLFIIGAAKCATSSLHTYLSAHPQIYMSRLKEPGYFSEPESSIIKKRPFTVLGKTTMKPYRNDMTSYLSLFEEAGDAEYVGESSTAYSQLPIREGVSDRIHAFNKDARIIYLMRDPVDRAISHYWWNVQNEGEKRDLHSSIVHPGAYRDLSYYAMQLRPYLDRFGRDRVYWLTAESLWSEPERILTNLLTWLGVDSSFMPPGLRTRENTTPDIVSQPKLGILDRLRFSGAWDRIGPWIPKPLRSAACRWNARKIDRNAIDAQPAMEFLRTIQSEQVAELRELLEYDFPEWTNVNALSACKS